VFESQLSSPLGLIWDKENWSCAYDSILVIIYRLWQDKPEQWSNIFEKTNAHLKFLSHGFHGIFNKMLCFEDVRDSLRNILHQKNSTDYPIGPVGISVANLALEIFKPNDTVSSSQQFCSNCTYEEFSIDDLLDYVVHAGRSNYRSTAQWMATMIKSSRDICPRCNNSLKRQIFYNDIPPFLVLEYPMTNIQTSHIIRFENDNNDIVPLKLRGIVYHGQHHFTCRIISDDGQIWYHDGVTTAQSCTYEGLLNDINNANIKTCKNKECRWVEKDKRCNELREKKSTSNLASDILIYFANYLEDLEMSWIFNLSPHCWGAVANRK
jgi:hypothetical protein